MSRFHNDVQGEQAMDVDKEDKQSERNGLRSKEGKEERRDRSEGITREPALLETIRLSSLLSRLSSPVDSTLSYLHQEQMLRSEDEEEEGKIIDYEDSNMALAHYDPSMATQIDLLGTLRAPPINVLSRISEGNQTHYLCIWSLGAFFTWQDVISWINLLLGLLG
ncbi:hypothetical protein CPB84DRAFT_1753727 [Gymnopilus junonius]|uniref:Uncharacterized protein n=1 Tax=Gymnopilus junonius TaxID=109634 RepID=A0A9P5TGH8_GYMJU|nr:hypothetical protein CPB84DRAFT_1753727 [Gymnopilus junonius]